MDCCGPAGGDRVDHAEGLEEGIDDVHDQQEERRRRQQAADDGEEPAPEPRAVDGGGLDHRPWDRLQRGEKEQEVIADAPPGRGDDDHKPHRLAAVQDVVPVIAQRLARYHDTTNAHARVEHETATAPLRPQGRPHRARSAASDRHPNP